MKEVTQSTAKSTKSDTDAVIESFNIQNKILIYLTDNCPSMKKAFGVNVWYGCFLHILSLVQKHAFGNDKLTIISNLISKSRRLVEYVNKSSKKKNFKPRLKQDVPTRFESFYKLLSSIKDNQINFELLKDDDKVICEHYRKINMTVLNYVLKIVEVFEQSRVRLGVSDKSTFHLVYRIYHILKCSLNQIKKDINLDTDELLEDDERDDINRLVDIFLHEIIFIDSAIRKFSF